MRLWISEFYAIVKVFSRNKPQDLRYTALLFYILRNYNKHIHLRPSLKQKFVY
jgi:hypothetical protein